MTYMKNELKNYYDILPDHGGLDALCKMELPQELHGKVALDVACRRGKGVYKLSEQAGKHGKAIGVDWRADMLGLAREGEAHAIGKAGLDKSNMLFVQAFPETLAETVGEGAADFAYVNCILNLFYDPAEALAQIRRALKPGGLLICDTVLSTGPRKASVVAEARALGNAVQAAPHRKDLMNWLASASFDVTSIGAVAGLKADPALDAEGNPSMPVATSDEPVSFVATSVRVYAPDSIDRHERSLLKDISKFR